MSKDQATIVIASAARTPVGAFNGALASLPAHDLGKIAIKAALERARVEAGEVSEVIMGQILAAVRGQNPARQASIGAGIPVDAPAWGMNQLCGSGLRAVALGAQQIELGSSKVVVAGGMESMSLAPHCAHLRDGTKMGDMKFIDTMIKDGLWDAFNGYHMGNTAENVARQWQITREEQDRFAVASQNKAEAAKKAGKFKDEITPVSIKTRKGETVVADDEYIKDGVTYDSVSKLRPAFDKEGTVTAANASGINDGAAAVVLMTLEEAKRRGITPLARIVSWAHAGVDPSIMGTGPIPASKKALEKAGWTVKDLGPDRGQRGVRGAGLRRQQRARLGHREGQRQWWRHRHRPPDRRLRRTRAQYPPVRDEAPQCQEGPGHPLHRRRHGRCHVRRARLTKPELSGLTCSPAGICPAGDFF
jgi:acetyl-CoA C-acetyltransferase